MVCVLGDIPFKPFEESSAMVKPVVTGNGYGLTYLLCAGKERIEATL